MALSKPLPTGTFPSDDTAQEVACDRGIMRAAYRKVTSLRLKREFLLKSQKARVGTRGVENMMKSLSKGLTGGGIYPRGEG